MTTIDRRTLLKASAWSVPVIAVAVATPLASASEVNPLPVKCVRVKENHGHGGDPGSKDWWVGIYSDGTQTTPMSNGEAMSHTVWGPLCRDVKHNS